MQPPRCGALESPKTSQKVMQNCAMCEKYRRERIEPMKGTEFPDRLCLVTTRDAISNALDGDKLIEEDDLKQ